MGSLVVTELNGADRLLNDMEFIAAGREDGREVTDQELEKCKELFEKSFGGPVNVRKSN